MLTNFLRTFSFSLDSFGQKKILYSRYNKYDCLIVVFKIKSQKKKNFVFYMWYLLFISITKESKKLQKENNSASNCVMGISIFFTKSVKIKIFFLSLLLYMSNLRFFFLFFVKKKFMVCCVK